MPIDPEKLAELIDRQWGPLVALVGREGGWAEDVVQQAMVKLAAEDPVPENPVAWLYRVARNLANNERLQNSRRLRRQQQVARPEQEFDSEWSSLEVRELVEYLDRLPAETREVLVARIWGGLPFEEITTVVGKSRTTVWRLYNAGLDQLREIYGVPCKTNNP